MADAPNLSPLMRSHITGLNESERCKNLRRRLLDIIGSATYKSWFYKTRLEEDPKTGYIRWISDCIWFNGQLTKRFGATFVTLNKEMERPKLPERKPIHDDDDAMFGYTKYLN